MTTSSIRQQISEFLARPCCRSVLQSLRNPSPSRALRLSLAGCLLFPLASLGVVLVATHPPARLADTLTHLRSGTVLHAGPQHLQSGGVAKGDARDVSSAPSAVSKGADHGVIAYGDRLKISFFESLGVALDDGGATSDHVVAAVFPRMDLTAEYAVDEGGSVNVPKLGQIATAGRTIAALQIDLAAVFKRAIGRESDVHVAIVERQPIYVLGAVRNAGTFKHTPGMIVLQALADAGGMGPGTADMSSTIESIRETERLRQAEEQLDRLLAKQARLIAQRENSSNIVWPMSIETRLSVATPRDGLNTLIAGELATLSAERKNYRQQLSLAERQVSIAQVELESQNMRADQLKVLSAKKHNRLRELEEIAAHGSVTQYKLTEVNVDILELAARQEDLRVALAQAERRLVEAETARAKIEVDYSAGLEKELAATQQAIDDCRHGIASMQAVTRVLHDNQPEVADQEASAPRLRITRRVAEGLTVLPATETTLLMPGDVVQVNSANRTDLPTSSIAQDTLRLSN